MRYFKLIIPIFITLFIYFLVPSTSYALTVTPIKTEITGTPGQTLYVPVTLINEQNVPMTFYSSFADFEAQGESGNPAFIQSKTDLDTWMSTDPSVTLAPNETKIVNVKIVVPLDADPGGHFAAAFFGTLPKEGSQSQQVAIGGKAGTLILLSVPGDVKEAGGLLDFSTLNHQIWYNTLPVSFNYRFRNDGGDRIKPVGTITMHDLVYLPADKIDANPSLGNILPNSTRRFDIDWIKNPRSQYYIAPSGKIAQFFDMALYQWHNFAVGPYFAKINLLYGTSAIRVSKTVFFFVFPWQLLVCLLILFIIIFWGGRKLIKRYNKYIIHKARAGMSTSNTADHV